MARKRTAGKSYNTARVLGREEWVNSGTGEVAEVHTIVSERTDLNFQKLWVGHILEAIDELGGAKLKFVFWLFDAIDNENRLIGSYRQLSEWSGVSIATVSRLMKKLKDADLLKKEAASVHRMNPDVVFRGDAKRRMNVLIKYRSIDDRQSELPIDDAWQRSSEAA
jgi:DNA-binding transcriptional ArsR family regulator